VGHFLKSIEELINHQQPLGMSEYDLLTKVATDTKDVIKDLGVGLKDSLFEISRQQGSSMKSNYFLVHPRAYWTNL